MASGCSGPSLSKQNATTPTPAPTVAYKSDPTWGQTDAEIIQDVKDHLTPDADSTNYWSAYVLLSKINKQSPQYPEAVQLLKQHKIKIDAAIREADKEDRDMRRLIRRKEKAQ